MAQDSVKRSRQWLFALAMVGAIVCIGVVVALLNRGQTLKPPIAKEEATALISQKNLAIGLLENGELAESKTHLKSLAERLPEEPLPVQNLVVAALLQVGQDEAAADASALAEADAALQQLKSLVSGESDLDWLAVKVNIARRQWKIAEDHLDALIARDSHDANGWYARYELLEKSDPSDDRGIGALLKSFDAAPDNLWLCVEWLKWLSTSAEKLGEDRPEFASDEELNRRLETVRQAMRPIVHEVTTFSRTDPNELLDRLQTDLQAAKWREAGTTAQMLANLLLPYSLPDQPRIRRHPLEFVRTRFRPSFYESYGATESIAPSAIPVSFKPAANLPQWQANGSRLLAVRVADFDLDGEADLIALEPERLVVLSRAGLKEGWEEIASVAVPAGSMGFLCQDFDADFDEAVIPLQPADSSSGTAFANADPSGGQANTFSCPAADVDVVVFGENGLLGFQNKLDRETGKRTLAPVSKESFPNLENIKTAVPADLDADGDLDICFSASGGIGILSNNGDWSFADITRRSSLPTAGREASQLIAGDWDRDMDVDILIADPAGSGWLENLRHGQFRWRDFDGRFSPLSKGVAFSLLDVDRNASWDVVATTGDGLTLLKTETPIPGSLRAIASETIESGKANGVRIWDYDNDGFDDLLAWDDTTISISRGLGDGRFEPGPSVPAMGQAIVDCVVADLDDDRDLDLCVVHTDGVTLLENEGGSKNHALVIALQAQQIKGATSSASGRVTPQGIGSLLELKVGEHYQARIVAGQRTHFGLGQASQADVVRITWLNGVPQNILRPAADRTICEQQILNTSCPYLYAWNGERFEFVTDLLWNAPLGLQLQDGVLAPAREWEYLKISGEQLVPSNGQYLLQITEELWEVAYIDQVRLIAIDHPADVGIYSNEKVGSAEMAEYRVHTVKTSRTPLSARNHRGRDLLPELSSEDNSFARVFDRKLQQGLVEESHFDIDLGDLGDANEVTLFLTGWVYPAATSMNVALTTNGNLGLPRPPSLHLSSDGETWREASPFMGFPGGKTKTIAVDLSEVLQPGERFVRIATTMEFYWDHVFFTVDEPSVETRETPLQLLSADLHYRGFSRVERDASDGPEQFHYDDVSTVPKWPPMSGKLTRFGDVTPLLRESDDRQVVIGAGDEITLRFAVPATPLPQGWTRDFFLHNVGWEKDANLHTVVGSTVEPLPHLRMQSYPETHVPEHFMGEEYLKYLQQYQTREASLGFWKWRYQRPAND